MASTGQGILGNNMFAYCGNAPVVRVDSGGQFWDTVFDLASIVSDVIEIAVNPGSIVAWGALAADVASLIVPGVSGGGQLVRVVTSSDEVLDAAKYADDIFDGAKQFFSKTDIGQSMHKWYDPIKDTIEKSDKLLNEALSDFGSQLRPDAVDLTNRIIYELKPYNKRAYKQATKQAKRYADILGGEWTIIIDMYTR